MPTHPFTADSLCHVVHCDDRVELHSPFFLFRLDTTRGLRAMSWENRVTGRSLVFADGAEVGVDIGLPDQPLRTPGLEVTGVVVSQTGDLGEVVFTLAAHDPALAIHVTYQWDTRQPVLRKFTRIVNESGHLLDRLLNVRLGTYGTDAEVTNASQPLHVNATESLSEKRSGFPAFLHDEFFVTLAHPAGYVEDTPGVVALCEYPGVRLAPGGVYTCMEAVYGVAEREQGPQAFVAHIQSRMRRVLRGHDRPYAIYTNFGSWPSREFKNTEEYMLHSLRQVAEGQQASGCHFDVCDIDFWHSYEGDLKEFDPARFPNGLATICAELTKLDTALGLWVDSCRDWSIPGNPLLQVCFSESDGKGHLCWATEPVNGIYTEAFRHHIREHGARLLKFDSFIPLCSNPRHAHLPGLYSVAPIQKALIEFLQALDSECPDIFLMLYWGFNSPWWLLHADTIFDAGLGIEGACPGDQPALHARDSVTQKLDQAQWTGNRCLPALGKDSLGVWLSDWPWNSQIGKERWQAGMVMDLCRGHLLAQPWSDYDWLTPLEREQMADFIALLKANPECFRHSRFVLGNPFNNEPYGYCCTDGRRAFIALHNCCWQDRRLTLELNASWGLHENTTWDLYRWYPDPTKLQGRQPAFGSRASITLRPFDILLLEAVPSGESPSLDRRFTVQPLVSDFDEASRPIDITAVETDIAHEEPTTVPWTVLTPETMTTANGTTLTRRDDDAILASGENPREESYTITTRTGMTGMTAIRLECLLDPSLPMMGPGRVVGSANFALLNFSVKAGPHDGSVPPAPIELQYAVADFSLDERHDIARTIDGDPKTGWEIFPYGGRPHVAIYHLPQPLGYSNGTTLEFTLEQGELEDIKNHNLGCLRLSVTDAPPPIEAYNPAMPTYALLLEGQAPVSSTGGTLVVIVEMTDRDGAPARFDGPGKDFIAQQATVAGEPVICQPVLGTATFPTCWHAWRLDIAPSPKAERLYMTVNVFHARDIRLQWSGYFVPNTGDVMEGD